MTDGLLRPKNDVFNDLPHPYEINLTNFTKVIKINEKDQAIPLAEFNFKTIEEISSMAEGSSVGEVKL